MDYRVRVSLIESQSKIATRRRDGRVEHRYIAIENIPCICENTDANLMNICMHEDHRHVTQREGTLSLKNYEL